MMKHIAAAIVIFLSLNQAEAKDLRCDQVDAFVEIGGQFHVRNPKVTKEFIIKAGKVYLQFMDSLNALLTKEEYNAEIKDLTRHADKYLAAYKKDPCQTFSHMEKTLFKGDSRYIKIQREAALMTPAKFEVEPLEERTTLPKIKEYITKNVRNKLATALSDNSRLALKEKITNQKTLFESFEKNQATYITKSLFYAFDPHSSYHADNQNGDFDRSISGSIVGIGVTYHTDEFGILIEAIIPNSPLDKSKEIEVGDHIVSVEGNSVVENTSDKFRDLLSGPAGTKVSVDIIKKDGKKKKVFITLDRIELQDDKVSSKFYVQDEKNVLYIKIPGFYYDAAVHSGASEDTFRAYVQALVAHKSIDVIIVDLRSNGGGLVSEALSLTGLFIGEQKVVMQTKTHDVVEKLTSPPSTVQIKEPLIVLTNKESASASEILTGALKDYARAVVVGEKTTYGKGTMQSVLVYPRSEGLGTISITVAQFYRPKGESTQIKGVPSDIIVPSPYDTIKYGESESQNPLSWDQVPSSDEDEHSLDVDLNELVKRSKKRVDANPVFKQFEDKKTLIKAVKELKEKDADPVLDETLKIAIDYLNQKAGSR